MDNSSLWSSFKENPCVSIKQEIFITYLNLIHYVIHQCMSLSEDVLDRKDYFQFGFEGLSEAIDRFDPDFGTKFETYAIQRIRGKIMDELRKCEKESPRDVISLNNRTFFNKGTSEVEVMQTDIPDYNTMPDNILESNILKDKLKVLIENLGYRDKRIIELYYYAELNYNEIAQVLGITVSRVSQVHSRIISNFQDELLIYK